MKLLTASVDARLFPGVLLEDGKIIDLARTEAQFTSLQAIIELGAPALARIRALASAPPREALLDLAQVRVLAPLPRPMSIRDCLGFEGHLKNCSQNALDIAAAASSDPAAERQRLLASGRFDIPAVWYQQPLYYKGNRFAISGPDDDVQWPEHSQFIDFEFELACVIGRQGRNIARAYAHEYIFGYTLFNDFSARDLQLAEQAGGLGPAKGKDFDGANAFGPVLVTRDEIEDVYALPMRARIDGELWTDGNSSSMHWRFEDMIAHVSRSETLYPGEVIGSGTVEWGCGLERQRFLHPGAVVELEVPGIGVLRNRVVRERLLT